MNIYSNTLSVDTSESVELINLTPQINVAIESSGVNDGFAIISSRHTTTALFVNEFEERLIKDIKLFLKDLAPPEKKYLHNDIHLRDCPPEEPENAHSHLIAMLLSSSEAIPIIDGILTIGQWQSIIFIELDGPRSRTVQLQIIGVSK